MKMGEKYKKLSLEQQKYIIQNDLAIVRKQLM